MGRRRDTPRRERAARHQGRTWTIRLGTVMVAIVVSVLTTDLWADWFDRAIGVLGDGSTAAAFVGWFAGFGVLVYVLVLLALRRTRPAAFSRTWWLGVVLLVPFITFQPSRTRRSSSIEDEYWYLGSFFDTYGMAIVVVLTAGAAGLLCLWLATRGDNEDPAAMDRWLLRAERAFAAILATGTVGTLVWALVGF